MKKEDKLIGDILNQLLNPDDLIKKYDYVKTKRTTWDSKWQEIQDQVFPNYRDFCGVESRYQPQTNKIRNHSAAVSGEIGAIVSSIVAQTADPSIKWLNLKFLNKQLNDLKPTRDWLHECCNVLYSIYADPDSFFYPSTYSFINDWFTLGTSCREIVLREDTGKIRFNCISMQYIYIDISGYGDIQNVYRRFSLTARQALDLWGNRLHPQMLEAAARETKQTNSRRYEFFEVIMPNPLKQKMPSLDYLSCVVDKANKYIVTYNFHAYNPYVISRFFVTPGEIYGRSNVWNVMPNIVIVNKVTKMITHGVDFSIFPILLTTDMGSFPKYPMTPGVTIQGLDSMGRPKFQTLPMVGNIAVALEFMKQQMDIIRKGLVVSSTILPPDQVIGTATESEIRTKQYSNAVRPLIVMLESEDLNLTIKRTLKLLEQTGQLPPFPYDALQISPEDLPDPIRNLNVTFSGPMATLQKMQDIRNQDEFLQKVMQIAQINPEVMDAVNMDQIVMEEAKAYNLNPGVINSDEVIQQVREERAKQAQQQQEKQEEMMNAEMGMRMAQTLGGKM